MDRYFRVGIKSTKLNEDFSYIVIGDNCCRIEETNTENEYFFKIGNEKYKIVISQEKSTKSARIRKPSDTGWDALDGEIDDKF